MADVTVICVWNNDEGYYRDEWLLESCRSIERQTHKDFNWILGFYGKHMMDAPGDTLGRMEARHIPSRTIMEARNKIIDTVETPWVFTQDGDDMFAPTILEKQLALTGPGVSAVSSLIRTIDADGNTLNDIWMDGKEYDRRVSKWVSGRRGPGLPWHHPGLMINVAKFLDVGGYEGRLMRGGDTDMIRRIAEAGEMRCVKEPLVYYRRHENQTVRRHPQGTYVS